MDWLTRESQLRTDFKACFNSDAGKRVLDKLVKDHYVFKTQPTPDPYLAAWQDGQRSLVLKIMEMVDTDLRALRMRYDQNELARQNRQSQPKI